MSKTIDCPQCQGQGYLLSLGPLDFSNRYEVFEEVENLVCCKLCRGEGALEVCHLCLTPFSIRGGAEVCYCSTADLLRAA